MRLNKYLAQAGIASRRQADQLIAAGRIRVNGQPVTALGSVVGPDDVVEVAGKPVAAPEPATVYLLHKPKGVISAASDSRGRTTVVDLVRDTRRLYPVGRLDRDTTGALLITNRGDLTFRLTHPRFGIARHYLAEVRGQLPPEAPEALQAGLRLKDGIRVKARLRRLSRHGKRTLYEVVLREGKNREIMRIFRHFGLPLLRLHRASFAGLEVDHLAPGKYRRLRPAEVQALYRRAESAEPKQLV